MKFDVMRCNQCGVVRFVDVGMHEDFENNACQIVRGDPDGDSERCSGNLKHAGTVHLVAMR